MDNLNDLKAIWLTAKTDDLPSSNEMLQMVKKFRNQRLRRKLFIIGFALALLVLMIIVVFIPGPTMLSTRIGEACTIITCIILVVTNTRSLKRFINLKDCSNKEFIEFLEQTRRNQVYYYKKTQVTGMAFASAGLLLYVYQMAHKDMMRFIIIYSIALIWILVLFLYVRPRNFKKQGKKLDETMQKLKNISEQLNN